jgi:hypothetical protein
MGSIDKYVFRTALAPLALILVSPAATLRMVRNACRLRLLGRPVTA